MSDATGRRRWYSLPMRYVKAYWLVALVLLIVAYDVIGVALLHWPLPAWGG